MKENLQHLKAWFISSLGPTIQKGVINLKNIEFSPSNYADWANLDKSIPHILDRKTLARLFELSNSSTLERMIIETLYVTGARIGELINIRVTDIEWDNRQIYIRNNKNGRKRIVFFTSECAVRLKKYLDERIIDSPYIFTNYLGRPISVSFVHNFLYEYSKALNLGFKMTTFTLRYTFAAHRAEKGMPLSFIQELLGLIDSNTTKLHYTPLTEARRNLYDSYQ